MAGPTGETVHAFDPSINANKPQSPIAPADAIAILFAATMAYSLPSFKRIFDALKLSIVEIENTNKLPFEIGSRSSASPTNVDAFWRIAVKSKNAVHLLYR
jgi:hypothetical protein